jgi:HEAT repeat protein
VGILVDRAGDDYYAGSGGTLGGALTNSFALLLDSAGNDGYSAVKVRHAEGGGRSARGMGSIGVLLDFAGKDLHGTRELDGQVRVKETYGALVDYADPPPPERAPPRRPTLTPEEAEAKVKEAAWKAEQEAWDFEKLWEFCCRWRVGEMADAVPVAHRAFHDLGDPAFEHVMKTVGTKQSLEFLAVQALVKMYGERAVEPLTLMLTDEDPRRAGRAAGLLADLGAKPAVDGVLPLLRGDKTKLAALDALARLAVPGVAGKVAVLLEDDTERVRVSAARCLQKLGGVTEIPGLVARLSAGEVFTVRYACEDVLVSFEHLAVPALLELVRSEAAMVPKRHAIRALGRIRPAEALPVLESLVENEDWRIRFEAVGALQRYVRAGDAAGVYAEWVLLTRQDVEEHPHVLSRILRGPAD